MLRKFLILLILYFSSQSSFAEENDYNPIVEQDGKWIIVYIPNHYQDEKLHYVHLTLNDENGERFLVTQLHTSKAVDYVADPELYSMVVFVAPDKSKLNHVNLSISYKQEVQGGFMGCETTKEINLLEIL
ncbi:hypothetical protein [Kangiella aquimarina]|uniref:Uncharacterized protein n=1 Tax=Kangiella aquimarina TaxID=261965 RepID=A0ABZ0X2S3_9GAMM|nr:hypothetical protein [Kangiella aquimarina]WQG84853.1 hypothetical protein SR900_10310 [Kangiella aquimarina]